MAQSKRASNRASMREGPLAALFSKTEEQEQEQSAEREQQSLEAAASAPETPEAAGATEEKLKEKAVAGAPQAHDEGEEESPPIPSPRERLRNVFSAEIPANMMERPGPATAAAKEPAKDPPAPVDDVYAREDRSAPEGSR
jgi:cell division protein FtsZ